MVPAQDMKPVAWAVYDRKFGGSKSLHWNEFHAIDGDAERFAAHPLFEFYDIAERILYANDKYGSFASSHEALGVASEEWDELRDAVRANDIDAIRSEALDLAAVLIRLWAQLGEDKAMQKRSVK